MSRYEKVKYKSRLLALLLAVILVLASAPVAFADGESGSCAVALT